VQVGIAINEHTDEDDAVVFLHACKMGLEGIVSKRLTERHWLDWFVDASGRHAANVARPVAVGEGYGVPEHSAEGYWAGSVFAQPLTLASAPAPRIPRAGAFACA
jgi:hypothetical protein